MPKGANTKWMNRCMDVAETGGQEFWYYTCPITNERKMYRSAKIFNKSVELHHKKCTYCRENDALFSIDTPEIQGIVEPTKPMIDAILLGRI
jgi:hypothetical protein